jgi:hypothetical protein
MPSYPILTQAVLKIRVHPGSEAVKVLTEPEINCDKKAPAEILQRLQYAL